MEYAALATNIEYLVRMSSLPLEIAEARKIIDEIDHALIDLLVRRRAVVKELFAKKHALGLPIVDPEREKHLLDERQSYARLQGISSELVGGIFGKVLEDSHTIDAKDANA
jgi:chorismate mutase / prephenate dehydrogenase